MIDIYYDKNYPFVLVKREHNVYLRMDNYNIWITDKLLNASPDRAIICNLNHLQKYNEELFMTDNSYSNSNKEIIKEYINSIMEN